MTSVVTDTVIIETTWGPITVTAAEGFIVSVTLPRMEKDAAAPPAVTGRRAPGAPSAQNAAPLKQAAAAVAALLEGRPDVELPPYRPLSGTPFQRRVWHAISGIRRGRTEPYGAVAAKAGCPGGARAAGQACGANPLPLLVPCHRVTASGGRPGGFTGGLAWKRHLLAVETAAGRGTSR